MVGKLLVELDDMEFEFYSESTDFYSLCSSHFCSTDVEEQSPTYLVLLFFRNNIKRIKSTYVAKPEFQKTQI